MARIDGRTLRLQIDGDTVACAKECTLNIDQDLPDASCKDDAGWNAHINGQKGWSVDVTALLDFAATVGIADLGTALIAGTSVVVLITTGVSNDTQWTGTADISNLTFTASNGAAVEYSGSMQGTGALTQSTVA